MKSRLIMLMSLSLVALFVTMNPPVARADTLEMKDGTQVNGIIKKVAGGEVTVEVGQETKVFKILEVTSMDFDTPHLTAGTSRLPLEHFLGNTEAQEIVGHARDVDKSAAEIRAMLDQIKKDWAGRTAIGTAEVKEWDARKEQFDRALSRYQEVLNDFYFHVLGKVDAYNTLAKEANGLYVGVKGPLNIGSPLVSKEMKQLPLKRFVPSNWYNTIFYEGYYTGYNEKYYKTE